MTPIDEADAMSDFLGALRQDVERMPGGSRRRIAARLAGAGAAFSVASGAALAGAAVQRGFVHSVWFGVLLGVPAGLSLGALAHSAFAPSPPAVAAPARVATAKVVPAPSALPAPVLAVEAPRVIEERLALPVVTKAAPIGSTVPSLEHELSLLEQARTRLAEGKASQSLELIVRHRSRYPKSALEQEREALTVRSLLAAGKREQARQRAEAFVRQYPSSVLRPSVERALETIP